MDEEFVKDFLSKLADEINVVISAIDGVPPATSARIGATTSSSVARRQVRADAEGTRIRVQEDVGDGWSVSYFLDGENADNLTTDVIAKEYGGEIMPLQYVDGNFRKYKNGLQYRFYFEGKQQSVYGKTKSECWKKRYNKELSQNIEEANKVPQYEAETFGEWIETWFKLYKESGGYKTGYLKSIKSYLRNYILPVFGERKIRQIRPIELQSFLVEIESDCTRTKCAAILSEVFRDATFMELVSRNPYEGVRFKHYEQPTLGALTHKQQLTFLDAVDRTRCGDWKMPIFARTLLMTGMRQGELNALRACDVDFENNEINVNATWDRFEKERVKPKTKAGRRTVPMAAPLADMLRPVVDSCRDGNELVFGYEGSYTPRYFGKIFKSLGLTFTGHITRHTFITNAYELGFPPYIVKRWVGHSEIKQADVYLELRKPAEFTETEITDYMRELKKMTVLNFER